MDPKIAILHTSQREKQVQMASRVKFNYLADELDTRHELVYGLKLGIHHMKSHSGGRIVVVGCAASSLPVPSEPLYMASKHAVLGLVRSTAQIGEVVETGISISWVAPWLTLTPVADGLQAATHLDTLKISPEDVALAIGNHFGCYGGGGQWKGVLDSGAGDQWG